MKIDQYFKSLLPSFTKDTVLEDCRITIGEIKDTVQPAYTQAFALMKNWKFKSPEVEQIQKSFKSLANRTQGNIIASIHNSIADVLQNLEEVDSRIQATFNEEVAAGGLTYSKAQLLQFVEAAVLYSKYSRKLLDFIYVYESAPFVQETDEQYDAIQDHLTPAQIAYVKDNIQRFCVAFNALTTQTGALKKQLIEIPDIVITDDNAQTLPHTVGQKAIDPVSFGLIPTWINPIYHIRIAVADWQFDRYKQSQAELQLLQMRKMNLEKLQSGQPNTALQQRIDEYSRRVQGLEAKIAKMEKDYA